MEVQNLSWKNHLTQRQNHVLLPHNIRGLIVGKSGCGKTTLLINFLLNPGWLDYNNLYVFGKALFQPEYTVLRMALEKHIPKKYIKKLFSSNELFPSEIATEHVINELAKIISETSTTTSQFFDASEDVPNPSSLDKSKKNLMIFDDLLLEKQNTCESYYVRGRHNNIDCFYLSQNYFKLPRQTIRENANFICLFPQDNKNIRHIYEDHASRDMTLDEFKHLCDESWSTPYGFVVIDLTSDKYNGKYRKNLDHFYFSHFSYM